MRPVKDTFCSPKCPDFDLNAAIKKHFGRKARSARIDRQQLLIYVYSRVISKEPVKSDGSFSFFNISCKVDDFIVFAV